MATRGEKKEKPIESDHNVFWVIPAYEVYSYVGSVGLYTEVLNTWGEQLGT